MSEVLQTQEVGSLAKPNWRVKAVAGATLLPEDLASAYTWAERLTIDRDLVDNVLIFGQEDANEQEGKRDIFKGAVKSLSALYAIRLQEQAGLDILYDGEQRRSEMYQYAVEQTDGFEWRGRVRAFDNKSYKKAACVDQPSVPDTYGYEKEYEQVHLATDKQIKVPLTGAYTLGAWSFDEHYIKSAQSPTEARRQLVLDLARYAIHPTIEALLEKGATWIQIDEPAATTVPGEVPLFVESFNESVKGLLGKFSVHICFSDYSLLFPHISKLENCSQFSLEFANRDSDTLGTDAAHRPAYETLHGIKQYCPESSVGLGVTNVHDDKLETAELIRDRVLRAAEILDDPGKIYPSPDCGLRTRSWSTAYDKLQCMVEGANLAKQKL